MRNTKLKELQLKVISAEQEREKANAKYNMLMEDAAKRFVNEEITEDELFELGIKYDEESNKSEFGIILMNAKNELIDYCQGMFTKLGMMDAGMDQMFKVCKTNYIKQYKLIEILMKF